MGHLNLGSLVQLRPIFLPLLIIPSDLLRGRWMKTGHDRPGKIKRSPIEGFFCVGDP
jgi:hypothetical protein